MKNFQTPDHKMRFPLIMALFTTRSFSSPKLWSLGRFFFVV